MDCMIGLTTDLEERQTASQNRYHNVRDWDVLAGPFSTKTQAQEAVTRLSSERGCEASAEGEGNVAEGVSWHVYFFRHDGPIEES